MSTRLTLDLSDDANERLTQIAKQSNISKAEAIRRALSLLSVAEREVRNGNSLAIVKEEGDQLKPVARLVTAF